MDPREVAFALGEIDSKGYLESRGVQRDAGRIRRKTNARNLTLKDCDAIAALGVFLKHAGPAPIPPAKENP